MKEEEEIFQRFAKEKIDDAVERGCTNVVPMINAAKLPKVIHCILVYIYIYMYICIYTYTCTSINFFIFFYFIIIIHVHVYCIYMYT